MNLLHVLAPYFERYLTLERVHPTATYDYKARGFSGWPVIEVTMQQPKCTMGSWLYVAIPEGAQLRALAPQERLYIGSQTGDRMFRGDGMAGRNFHHAQMRLGNGDDTPVKYLREHGRVEIQRMGEPSMKRALVEVQALASVAGVLESMRRKHLGYWLEHLVLAVEPKQWRWITAAPDREAVRLAAMLKG